MRGRPFDTVAVPPPPLRLGSRFAGPGADTSPPLSLQERGSPRPSMPRTKSPDRPKAAGFRTKFPEGDARSRVARVLAACRCRMSMSRCRCSADLAPPGSARGDFGRRGLSSLTRGRTSARPPGAPARNGAASRNPQLHPAARCLATAPMVGCSAGSIGMGWRGGDKSAVAYRARSRLSSPGSRSPSGRSARPARSPRW